MKRSQCSTYQTKDTIHLLYRDGTDLAFQCLLNGNLGPPTITFDETHRDEGMAFIPVPKPEPKQPRRFPRSKQGCYRTQRYRQRDGEWYFWLISLWDYHSDCLIEMGAPL